MDMKDFITQTLTQIVDGVKAAREQLKDTGANVNPPIAALARDTAAQVGFTVGTNGELVTIVDFDVGLDVDDQGKGPVQINIGTNYAQSSGGQPATNTPAHRVSFKIPISLP